MPFLLIFGVFFSYFRIAFGVTRKRGYFWPFFSIIYSFLGVFLDNYHNLLILGVFLTPPGDPPFSLTNRFENTPKKRPKTPFFDKFPRGDPRSIISRMVFDRHTFWVFWLGGVILSIFINFYRFYRFFIDFYRKN